MSNNVPDTKYLSDWNQDLQLTKDEAEAIEVHKRCIRAFELLKACRSLLNKQNESIYVLNMLETEVEYDDSTCDGTCLLEDIEQLLIESDELEEGE